MTDLSIKNLSYVDNFKHTVMGNFANFKGRASRSEYWRFYGITIVIAGIINVLSALFMNTALSSVFGLISMAYNVAILLPSIGLGVRRLHDVGKSGWMLLISLVPFGIIYVIYLLAQKGDEAMKQSQLKKLHALALKKLHLKIWIANSCSHASVSLSSK